MQQERRTHRLVAPVVALIVMAAGPGAAAQVPPGARARVVPPAILAPPAAARDVAVVGVDHEQLAAGERFTVHLSYIGDRPSLPLQVTVALRNPERAQHQKAGQMTASPQPGVAVTQDVSLVLEPPLPPGTYHYLARVGYDGQDANTANDLVEGDFTIPSPPDLRVVQAHFDDDSGQLVVTMENRGAGEATSARLEATIDGQTSMGREHGRLGPGERTDVDVPVPAGLAPGSHAVVIVVAPTPADAAPDDNTLRATFSVPEPSRWPWYAGAAVAAVAAATVVRSRLRARAPAVPTVKGVPGATSARVDLPPGTTHHGFGLRWTADRGTARVTVPGPPQSGRALSETLR